MSKTRLRVLWFLTIVLGVAMGSWCYTWPGRASRALMDAVTSVDTESLNLQLKNTTLSATTPMGTFKPQLGDMTLGDYLQTLEFGKLTKTHGVLAPVRGRGEHTVEVLGPGHMDAPLRMHIFVRWGEIRAIELRSYAR